MATFRRRMGKWEVRVRRYNNKTISKLLFKKRKLKSGQVKQKIKLTKVCTKIYIVFGDIVE